MVTNEIVAGNRTMSHAIHNAKMLLQADGTDIEAAGKAEAGQLAFALNSSAQKRKGWYYNLSIGKKLWHNNLVSLLQAKYGTYQPRSATFASNLDGIMVGATAQGTVALAALDTANGMNNTFTTVAAGGSAGGFNLARLYTVRNMNPVLIAFFKNSVTTNLRFFVGWTSSTAQIGNNDDPLNALSGFGIAKLTTSGNLRIINNDGAGATVNNDTGVAASTNAVLVILWADGQNNKFWWSINGSDPAQVTSDIPGATTSLSMQQILITTAAAGIVHTGYGSVITSDW